MTTTDAIEAALDQLSVAAPPSLRPNVLAEVGLADRFARMDSPIGRSSSPGTGSACPPSRPTPTTPPSRRTTRPARDDAPSPSSRSPRG